VQFTAPGSAARRRNPGSVHCGGGGGPCGRGWARSSAGSLAPRDGVARLSHGFVKVGLMRAEAIIYVGDLVGMRALYAECFGLSITDSGPGYCGLSSAAWLVTLVQSDEALPATMPPPRRGDTPVKLGFEVPSIEELRRIAARLGGQVSPADAEWEFRNAVRCDCLDPEGNVIQLVQQGG
jgi:predicted enzyme related to lactoylglutathione lyase